MGVEWEVHKKMVALGMQPFFLGFVIIVSLLSLYMYNVVLPH